MDKFMVRVLDYWTGIFGGWLLITAIPEALTISVPWLLVGIGATIVVSALLETKE